MTSYDKKYFVGLHDSLPVRSIADVFNDVTSMYSLEQGNLLRDALKEYLRDSLRSMKFSSALMPATMDFNASLLRLIKELLQRGFFLHKSTLMPVSSSGDSDATTTANTTPDATALLSQIYQAAEQFMTKFEDSPEYIQKAIIERVYEMIPFEVKNMSLEAEMRYVSMIDAVVDVLDETFEINKLLKVELFAKVTDARNKNANDTTKEDVALAKALLSLFCMVRILYNTIYLLFLLLLLPF